MPQPTPGDVHVDFLLGNLSVAYAQGADYIADRVFPIIPTAQQSNRYRTYPRGAWFRSEARKRAPGTETPGSGWEYSSDSYFCDVWGVHKDIDDQTRANEDPGLGLETDATNFVTQQMLIKRDLQWGAKYFVPGVWSFNLTGIATGTPTASQFLQWDQGASTPLQDVRTRAIAMQKITGLRPNTLVLGPEVEVALLNHPQIIDRIKYTQRGVLTYELLAEFFGVQRVLVANAVVNTAPENAVASADSTASFNFMFGKHMLMCYVNPNPGLRAVSAGYIFSWTGLLGVGAYGGRIKRFRMEEIASDRVEIEAAWDHKIIAPDLGCFWNNLVA